MCNSTSIMKLVYKRDFFDISQMHPDGKLGTTIIEDGAEFAADAIAAYVK